jgi:hypothetical protein
MIAKRTANTPQTRRAKGNRAERKVAELYRRYGIDERATRMPMSGAMSHFKGDIWKPNDYTYVDEVKCQETVKFWLWWEQALSQAPEPRVPLLHITSNNRPVLTVMRIETYMDLRREILDLEEIIKDYEKKEK